MKKIKLILLLIVFNATQIAFATECSNVAEKLYSLAEADVRITSARGELMLGDLSLESQLKSVRKENSESLKKIVKVCGWPTEKKYGEAAAAAAWLVVQHADDDPGFQSNILELLSPMVKNGEESPVRFAYLQDRTELKRTGKQIYGTQLLVDAEGISLPLREIDSIEAVNKRRAEIGLETVEDYVARLMKNRAMKDAAME